MNTPQPKKIAVKKVAVKIDKVDTPKERMLKALEKSLGVVSTACLKAKISRQCHYGWLAEDEAYKAAVIDIKNIGLDFVESKMFNQIKFGDTSLIKFYLSTQGKNRGYVERQEIANTNTKGEDIEPQVFIINGKEIKF